ncbi:MAG: DUF6445 family protein [Sphingomicrobium sp.]
MSATSSLLQTNPGLQPRHELIGGRIPALLVDNFLVDPDGVRDWALSLDFQVPPYAYPGRIAPIPECEPSLPRLKDAALSMLQNHYLPHIPPIQKDGQPLTTLRNVLPDFAIVDVHPDELSNPQRIPHVDPVPIFGLVYLNREERGGTMFFAQKAPLSGTGAGYLVESNDEFELIGSLKGQFNRLVIYPGFVPHTGEVSGDWIRGEERFTAPRLTLRLPFFP